MRLLSALALIAALLVTGCKASDGGNQAQPKTAEAAVAPILTMPDAVAAASFAKPLEARVSSQGRGKFVQPLFRALAKERGWGLPIARRIYAEARPLYHPIVTRNLDKLGFLPGIERRR